MESDEELAAYAQTLTPDELEYARQFADHLATGAPRPEWSEGIDPKVAADIRKAFARAWARHVWGGRGR